ncbi:tripartite tricarboxylate transporter substrate binding protein [Pseudorhodoferax sp. Leaf265]|uniref:Bug family tripartite tricarboxylate transporter substrate binding protein n=1 Tax=Pseudorhodoferax sp. Leaf265 TaxID=1736315 RepID=UPI0009E86C11|nr:tripartite tricarboxylate transporter substrate binding protein [Pseudorhodoferax sp. Leaf265]
MRQVLCATALVAACMFASAPALAQAWPTKPITIVVPWPAGGPSDTVARPMAKGLSDAVGKPTIVDNRGGAGGNIGSALVAAGPADGHTLLITSSAPIVINPYIYKKMPFDPQKDLVPVTNLLRVPLVLVVHPSVMASNLKELVALVRSKNGDFQYASSGNGTPQHLTGQLFKTAAKLDLVHIPYKGSAGAISDVIAGHAPMMFDSTVAILPHIRSGKVRAIAVTGAKRSPQLPDIPTVAEAGMPELETYAWYGMFAPAKTPNDVVTRINVEALKVMKGEEYQRVLKEAGAEFVGDTPENFASFVKAEQSKWSRAAKASGASID